MSAFEEETAAASPSQDAEEEEVGKVASGEEVTMIRLEDALEVVYCPNCGFPPEYCCFGADFDKCVPWILENMMEVLDEEVLTKLLGEATLEDGDDDKKKKKKSGIKKKAAAGAVETKVVVARVQRQKRKFITVVSGLDTVPNLKLKDACKALGKKYASGASINEAPGSKTKEIVIQGDVASVIAGFIATEFAVPMDAIFMMEDGKLTACA
jgi:density-regulated protein